MKIYVASSWRNLAHPAAVQVLRAGGHDVYDFRHPEPGNVGFSWAEIDPNWQQWSTAQYRAALQHPIAISGYGHDIKALRGCDVCVLVLPAGRSASWELGYAMGQGKRAVVLRLDDSEPELMYQEAEIIGSLDDLVALFGGSIECGSTGHAFIQPSATDRAAHVSTTCLRCGLTRPVP